MNLSRNEKILLSFLLITVTVFSGVTFTLVNSQSYAGSISEIWLYPPTSSSAYTIGQYNSTFYYAKNGTTGNYDFLSSNAATVINGALNLLTSGRIWKEKIVLLGNFTISSTIKVPSYTIFDASATRLTASSGLNTPVISNYDNVNGNTEIEIYVGLIDGNANQQTNGGYGPYVDTAFPDVPYGIRIEATNLARNCSNLNIKAHLTNTYRETIFLDNCVNVELAVTCNSSLYYEGIAMRYSRNIKGNIIADKNVLSGVFLDNCWNVELSAVTSNSPGTILTDSGYGFGLSWCNNTKITVTSFGNLKHGIFCVGSNTYNSKANMIDANSYLNGGDGIYLENCTNIVLEGNYHDNTQQGIDMSRVTNSTIIGCVITNNNYTGVYNSSLHYHGIYGFQSDDIIISGCTIKGNNHYRPLVMELSDYWSVTGNDFRNGGILLCLFNGTHNFVRNNQGYISENWGYATSVVDGTIIDHGLDDYPAYISITVIGNAYQSGQAGLLQPTVDYGWTRTNFTIKWCYVKFNTATNETSIETNTAYSRDVFWYASVDPKVP